ncbi:hypothetical protein B0T10DRAFT_579997 [Thelonectria olida]|uniref:T6SS Phospholipase effector Tle1-like catalytic domain-containing protein n=1 Tax=Thelonectria olida TaxID=1576542 RepID=A0A9P9ALW1_9HYPO|nr:hypothetical protein B0T10DRAFT_579997 [Thelonectria olida]
MPRKLILLCDGTWCGREANTETNIYLLAKMIGVDMKLEPALLGTENVKACYTNGVGVGSTLLDPILDDATSRRIDDECKAAYQFIVENYTPQHEIWMFGLSRGAFIVRSIAGMINNCGIITPTRDDTRNIDREETRLRCDAVYEIYRSEDEWAYPQSAEMEKYRRGNSHNVRTPVKFMGIFDTVGRLGVPELSPRQGFVWPESFYDNNISSVVENTYHALSMHDRLSAFRPCLARRNPKHGNNAFPIHEKWFPGTHYDICRQKFRLFRPSFEELALWPLATLVKAAHFTWPLENLVSKVEPNDVLSDLTLRWMLESIRREDPHLLVIPDINQRIQDVNDRLQQKGQNTGSGDVYADLLRYIPFGIIIRFLYRLADIRPLGRETGEARSRLRRAIGYMYESLLEYVPFLGPILREAIQLVSWPASIWSYFWRGSGETLEEWLEAVLGVSAMKQGLLALKDRAITDPKADVYHYEELDQSLNGLTIRDLALFDDYRYPSETFESFLLFRRDMDSARNSPDHLDY